MPKAAPKFIVIDEVSSIGRRAYGPFKSFKEAAAVAMQWARAYVLPLEPPPSANSEGPQ